MNLNYTEPLYLARYLGVMRDRLPPQFLISRSICVNFDRDIPIQELWEMHDDAMKSFREMNERITSIKELTPPASGQEPELVPSHTIFFTGCNFTCIYCQNWDISQAPQRGTPILPQDLVRIITIRRASGSRNVKNDDCARRYSNASDYWNVVTRNFLTAYTSSEILLRHLVLPSHLDCCTAPIVKWTKKNILKLTAALCLWRSRRHLIL